MKEQIEMILPENFNLKEFNIEVLIKISNDPERYEFVKIVDYDIDVMHDVITLYVEDGEWQE